jgi:hypothetical protein
MNKLTTVDKEKKKNQKEKKINNIHIVCSYLLLISVYKYKAAYSQCRAKRVAKNSVPTATQCT